MSAYTRDHILSCFVLRQNEWSVTVCSDMVAAAENSSGKAPLIKTRNVRRRPDQFNERHRLFIATASPGNFGSDDAGADVPTVPGFGKDIVGRLQMWVNQLAGWPRHARKASFRYVRNVSGLEKETSFQFRFVINP